MSPHVLQEIVPIVAEPEWLAALSAVDTWFPPSKNTIIIAPHPDDESLAAGGLIAGQRRRGTPVTVIAVTNGGAAYAESQGLEAARQLEQEQALEALGVARRQVTRLNLPDSAVAAHESQLAQLLLPLITSDSLVIAPWKLDWHPDHEACGRAVEKVCHAAGAQLVSYVFWTWHRKTIESLVTQHLRRFELDENLQSLKQSAILCHQSQLRHESGKPILPELLLAPAKRPFETFITNA